MAFQGHGSPPEWYVLEVAAEAWGVPPWVLEESAPALWLDKFAAVKGAEAQASNPKKLSVGQGSGNRTRLA